MKDFIFSLIRTIVPNVVAGLISWLALRFNFIVDEGTKAQLILLGYGLTFGAYYFVVRWLEKNVAPKFSWFLGDFRKGLTEPVYPDPVEIKVVPPAVLGGE